MGKVIFWLVVVFVLLFVVRVISASKRNARRRTEAPPQAQVPETMVRCLECGVYLPREEARSSSRGFQCRDGQCETRKAKTR